MVACREHGDDGCANRPECVMDTVVEPLKADLDEWKRRAEEAEAEEKTSCKCKFGPDHKEVKICEWHQFIVQQGVEDGKKIDALAAMVGEMREALKRQVETCCCGWQPCSRCKDSMAAVVLDLPQAAKIAEARKKLQQAWKGWNECDCEKNCCGDPDAWCKHFEPMREAFDECERLCSEKS